MSDLTREEAISTLEMLRFPEPWGQKLTKRAEEALDMAISALSAEGEYIKKEDILACQTTFTDEAGYEYKVIEVEEVEELPTYSFPDSAESKEDKKIGDLTLRELKEMGVTVYTSPSLTNI